MTVTKYDGEEKFRSALYGRYYIFNCEYCKKDIITDAKHDGISVIIEKYNPVKKEVIEHIGEFEGDELKGFKEVKEVREVSSDFHKDIFTIKCPNCGAIHKFTRDQMMSNQTCNLDGTNRMIFNLTEKETEAAKEFIKETGSKHSGAIGGNYSYKISPNSIGHTVEIAVNINGKEVKKDITDIDSW